MSFLHQTTLWEPMSQSISQPFASRPNYNSLATQIVNQAVEYHADQVLYKRFLKLGRLLEDYERMQGRASCSAEDFRIAKSTVGTELQALITGLEQSGAQQASRNMPQHLLFLQRIRDSYFR